MAEFERWMQGYRREYAETEAQVQSQRDGASYEVLQKLLERGGITFDRAEFVFGMHGVDIDKPRSAEEELLAETYLERSQRFSGNVIAEIDQQIIDGSAKLSSIGFAKYDGEKSDQLTYSVEREGIDSYIGRITRKVGQHYWWMWGQNEPAVRTEFQVPLASITQWRNERHEPADYTDSLFVGYNEIYAALNLDIVAGSGRLTPASEECLGRIATFQHHMQELSAEPASSR